jgi:hypothetical protein
MFAVCAQVALVTALLFGVHVGSTAEAFSTHPAHEFLASAGGINVHSDGSGGGSNKWIARKGGLCGGHPSGGSRMLFLLVSFSATLADSNVYIGRDGDQSVKSR